jgi:hypothetical protein
MKQKKHKQLMQQAVHARGSYNSDELSRHHAERMRMALLLDFGDFEWKF